MKLQIGKRYWFRDRECVYSGLYAEDDKNNSNAILIRKNGDRWSIPKEHIFRTVKDATHNFMDKKHLKIID